MIIEHIYLFIIEIPINWNNNHNNKIIAIKM